MSESRGYFAFGEQADAACKAIRATRNAQSYLMRHLGLTNSTIGTWPKVPMRYVFEVSTILKVPVELLRPDFFINDPLRRESVKAMLDPRSPKYQQLKIGKVPRLPTGTRRKIKTAALKDRRPQQQRSDEQRNTSKLSSIDQH